MSPEAFDGKRNEQTDIWSVGVIFYQLLAGRLPYQQADITSLLGAILMRNPEPLPSRVPKPLQNVIVRALSKEKIFATNRRLKIESATKSARNRPKFSVRKIGLYRPISKKHFAAAEFHPPIEKKNKTPHIFTRLPDCWRW